MCEECENGRIYANIPRHLRAWMQMTKQWIYAAETQDEKRKQAVDAVVAMLLRVNCYTAFGPEVFASLPPAHSVKKVYAYLPILSSAIIEDEDEDDSDNEKGTDDGEVVVQEDEDKEYSIKPLYIQVDPAWTKTLTYTTIDLTGDTK